MGATSSALNDEQREAMDNSANPTSVGATVTFSRGEMKGAFIDGLYEAARVICSYCNRSGAPEVNEEGVPVHRVFSSRGLASDHSCPAQMIYDRAEEEKKSMGMS